MNNPKLITTGITFITLFFPWFKAESFGVSLSVNGFQSGWVGILFLISLILAIIFDYIPEVKNYSKYVSLAPILFCLIGLGSGIGEELRVLGYEVGSFGLAWGIFLTLITSIINSFFFFKKSAG